MDVSMHGTTTNGFGPPPSTLAAQIVENIQHARPRREPATADRGTGGELQNLLDEFLRAGPGAFAGTDLATRYQLVDVLLKACSQYLDQVGPFDNVELVNKQSVQVLEIVQSTIAQSADVLLYQADFDPSSGEVVDQPFFLSLISRLLVFIGDQYDVSVAVAGLKAIKACVAVENRGAFLKHKAKMISRYAKKIAEEILKTLEQGHTSSSLLLPSDWTIHAIWPAANSQTIPKPHVREPNVAWLSVVAARLLSLFAPDNEASRRTQLRIDLDVLKQQARLAKLLRARYVPSRIQSRTMDLYQVLLCSCRQYLQFPKQLLFRHQIVATAIAAICAVLQQALNSRTVLLPESLGSIICSVLCDLLRVFAQDSQYRHIISDQFAIHVESLLDEPGNWSHTSLDLQLTFVLVVSLILGRELDSVETFIDQIQDKDLATRLSTAAELVGAGQNSLQSSGDRPRKRLRLLEPNERSLNEQPEVELDKILHRMDLPSYGDERVRQPDLWKLMVGISDEKQTEILKLMARAACYRSMGTEESPCKTCAGTLTDDNDREEQDYLGNLFCLLTSMCTVQPDQKPSELVVKAAIPRVYALMALDRILSHTNNSDHLNLHDSPLGKWCQQCLVSKAREVRTMAGRVLRRYVKFDSSPEIPRRNRVQALDILRQLAEKDNVQELETGIWALGQLAELNVGYDEMNIILFRLVDYLGHPNPLVSGLAYDEILRISNHEAATAKRLLDPYWSTIAVKIVGDLTVRPSALQRLCEILGISPNFFMSFTRIHTIPYLVLTKKNDVLERIASVTLRPDGKPSTVAQLCLNNDQLPSLLARILMEPTSDPASLIHTLLSHASSEFNDMDVFDLLKIDQAPVAFEIFQRAGELGDAQIDQARKAITFLAENSTRRQGSSARRSTRRADAADHISTFFETHSLAIIKSLSDIVTEVDRPQLLADRRRCLAGIRQMIAVAGESISVATPQLSACLRSTIEVKELCDDGLASWILMTRSLDDAGPLIDATFALIERHWDTFKPSTQQSAQELLSWLFAQYSDLMRQYITTLPSLGDIPLLSKFEADIAKFKGQLDQRHSFTTFAERLESEDPSVILRTLEELEVYLESNAAFLQQSSQSERPEPIVGRILQVLLDTCTRYAGGDKDIAHRCARCLGLIGCLDPSRIELQRDNPEIVVLSNFLDRAETVDFIVFFLEQVIVPSFQSNMNTRSQNFLGFAMQELLQVCDFRFSSTVRGVEDTEAYRKWLEVSEESRAILKPFMSSKYTLKEGNPGVDKTYPIFQPEKPQAEWLRELVYDLLRKAQGDNAQLVFSIGKRIVRGQDLTISSFLLPYIILNVLIGENGVHRADIGTEFLNVLGCSLQDKPQSVKDNVILCSQDMFRTLDYLTKWVHRKRALLARTRLTQIERTEAEHAIQVVQMIIDGTPPETMANRAIECRNYSRALFYWEQYMRQWHEENKALHAAEPQASDFLYEKLQEIYVCIDEPDGIEGVSAYLQLFNINQQVMEHRKVGRWAAVQTWSELQLAEEPNNEQFQLTLLNSIREAGQYDMLLNEIEGLKLTETAPSICKPFAIEACWETSNWEKLQALVPKEYAQTGGDFASGVGSALQALYEDKFESFDATMEALRIELVRGLSSTSVSNLQTCRQTLLQLHALTEIDTISDVHSIAEERSDATMASLDTRLDAVGAFSADKQYVLGLRRAAMLLAKVEYSDTDVSGSWLQSAKLFRKQGSISQAFRAILHASQLEDQTAMIEHAKLLWKEGNQRKAIQSLEGAIIANVFESYAGNNSVEDSIAVTGADPQKQQNILEAKAKLLLAKWTDQAGQTQSNEIVKHYQAACALHTRWEKGQYCLGKHYDKLLQSEKSMPPNKMSQTVLTGELAKHVIENYVRGMAWGARYVYQTLPRCLTLWCEMGSVVGQVPESKFGTDEVFRQHIIKNKRKIFDMTLAQLKKYIDRLPAWIFYTALNQVCARICHPEAKVFATLADIVVKVCLAHPQQSLWALLSMVRSTQKDRMVRGQQCIARVQEHARKVKSDGAAAEIKIYVQQGSRTTEQLLDLCNADLKKFQRRQSVVSLKELGFNHKSATPCKLVVPVQSNLALSLPTVADGVSTRSHKAFSKDVVTITTFLDEVTLMSSLQRPRKVDMRGSDGNIYSLLCKPKDDLRLDQRLLEYNAMIQRLLKKDAESSKRRLYVKTYAVTPLNEECGLIEWVHGLKTHRDILLKLYTARGVSPDYREISQLLEEAIHGDITKFTEKVMGMFPNVFHEWFVDTFPEPEAWYAARLRYTRSAAVMSMLGHTLGLGDRHSENITIEEGNGGVMHVDFNCLFDKGQTFEKPEKVPFRLTANMVDAFGAYGYEGPFRKACELSMAILRQNEDTLMTILEQFVHDPTIDLMSTRKKKTNNDVPNTPEGVLDSVRNKLRGLLPKESVPLSVGGYVDHLIKQARDPYNLASMYIGWCAFL